MTWVSGPMLSSFFFSFFQSVSAAESAFRHGSKKDFGTHAQKLSETRFLILLILILFMLVLTPFLDEFVQTRILKITISIFSTSPPANHFNFNSSSRPLPSILLSVL